MRRLLWPVWLVACALFVLVPPLMWAGPAIEARVSPVRVDQAISGVHRDRGMLRFVWVSDKKRMAPSNDVDVFVSTPTDHFPWALSNDVSPAGAPPCSALAPWSHGYTVGTGHHEQPYCIQVPSTVQDGERIRVTVVVHYRGLWGLWDMPVTLPEIIDPP